MTREVRQPGTNATPALQPDRPYKWQDDAVCADVRGFTERPEPEQQAVCADCTVRTPCAGYALARPTLIHKGIVWGGLTADQLGTVYRKSHR